VNNSHEKTLATSENNFGEVLRATGLMATANPLRFSTKFQDDETDLLYYGYRYYSASAGRWTSRDPVREVGFRLATKGRTSPLRVTGSELNEHCFVGDNSLKRVDVLGLSATQACCNEFKLPHSHLRTCEEACAEASRDWDFYVTPGGVICNGNQPCPCISPWPSLGYSPGKCPAIDEVLMQHEKSHVPLVKCGKCGLYPAEPPSDMDWDAEECTQRKKTLEQLRLLEGTLDPDCAEVCRRLIEWERMSTYRCPSQQVTWTCRAADPVTSGISYA